MCGVLVVDEEEGLSGIFTAKDLAFRVRHIYSENLLFQLIPIAGYC